MNTLRSLSRLQRPNLPNLRRNTATITKPITVLGIETSCDDTSAAVVTSDRRILSESVRHQYADHEPLGGIVPSIAARRHMENLPAVICEALNGAGVKVADLDAIAVTRGPGLSPCLAVGVNAAKTLAAEAHALTARLTTPNPIIPAAPYPPFPFLALLISGGHTLVLLCRAPNSHTQLGTTLDDAIGEAIDKTSRLLGLRWAQGDRGGPGVALEQAAARGDPARFEARLPLPMSSGVRAKEIAFSFCGLKTAAGKLVEGREVDLGNERDVADLAAAFQAVCVTHLEKKLEIAIRRCKNETGEQLSALVVSGGVASNKVVRSRLSALAAIHSLQLICPPPQLCTDNGVMIAWTGIERFQAGLVDDYEMGTIPKWSIEELGKRSEVVL
ncbi:glycoprotease family-domain-containing protein [Endogone sp. FLAS-F59071]|nr:glycoprotease family-domain-containing protein [Endogone sp. FLAS-F59071]|eukprot:RUS15110.1 glycoprotease family-domain-containing protein [Endogone sp. FLAS-F59071]